MRIIRERFVVQVILQPLPRQVLAMLVLLDMVVPVLQLERVLSVQMVAQLVALVSIRHRLRSRQLV